MARKSGSAKAAATATAATNAAATNAAEVQAEARALRQIAVEVLEAAMETKDIEALSNALTEYGSAAADTDAHWRATCMRKELRHQVKSARKQQEVGPEAEGAKCPEPAEAAAALEAAMDTADLGILKAAIATHAEVAEDTDALHHAQMMLERLVLERKAVKKMRLKEEPPSAKAKARQPEQPQSKPLAGVGASTGAESAMVIAPPVRPSLAAGLKPEQPQSKPLAGVGALMGAEPAMATAPPVRPSLAAGLKPTSPPPAPPGLVAELVEDPLAQLEARLRLATATEVAPAAPPAQPPHPYHFAHGASRPDGRAVIGSVGRTVADGPPPKLAPLPPGLPPGLKLPTAPVQQSAVGALSEAQPRDGGVRGGGGGRGRGEGRGEEAQWREVGGGRTAPRARAQLAAGLGGPSVGRAPPGLPASATKQHAAAGSAKPRDWGSVRPGSHATA